MIGKLLTVIFLGISVIFASCASHTAVYPDPVNIQSVIQPGDTVKIVTKDNQEIEFVVTEVTDEAIIGENIKVPLNDITEMKEEIVSAGENLLIITILTVGVASAIILSPAIFYAISPESVAILDTLDEVPDWVRGCNNYYPGLHYGDFYALETAVIFTTEYRGIDERLCFEECESRFNCKYEGYIEDSRQKYFKGIKSCGERLQACKYECMEKGHPIGDIAEHIEGGYYSDGSYYAICTDKYDPFLNIHPTKDKYEKTKWQKDRDECIKLTFENVKTSFWNQRETRRVLNRSIKYYRECLNERGYSIRLY